MAGKINLGQAAAYPDKYDASLLMAIPRAVARGVLGSSETLVSMTGKDIWQAYELSWLDPGGKPRVARAVFEFDCHSPAIIESKSFKYYLNSFNQTMFDGAAAVRVRLETDLAKVAGHRVEVALSGVNDPFQGAALEGVCVDELCADNFRYTPDADLLAVGSNCIVDHCLYSHLLKSNCPVTGQPDWATLWIKYSGKQIVPQSFLRYVVSFRQHQDFHENCVEKIYCDIMQQCLPDKLSVYACYTRRGGLDINPFRTSCPAGPPRFRVNRQ